VNYNPKLHHRRTIRLKDYDYAQPGWYYVTVCTHHWKCLFGEVEGDEVLQNEFGRIADDEWLRTLSLRREVELDDYRIMPNHLHGIIIINDRKNVDALSKGNTAVGTHGCASRQRLHRQPKSLGSIIAGFKSAVTAKMNTLRGTPGSPVWQDNYYEHIIRNAKDLDRIRQYIANNPRRWSLDKCNPKNIQQAQHASEFEAKDDQAEREERCGKENG